MNEHLQWITNILIVKRKQRFRSCLDPYVLDKATLDEIHFEPNNAKVFTVLDAKNEFC